MMIYSLLIFSAVMTAPVKALKTSDKDNINTNDILNNNINNPNEGSKRIIISINNIKKENNNNEISTLKSIIDNISKLSSKNSNRRFVDKNYHPHLIRKNKYYSTSLKDIKDISSSSSTTTTTTTNYYNKKISDSKIFYVSISSSAPYHYEPRKFSAYSLLQLYKNKKNDYPVRQHNQYNHNHNINYSLINLPIDFMSNGKPTLVQNNSWEKQQSFKTKRESSIIKLNKGPYKFNGIIPTTALYYLFNGSIGQTSMQHHQSNRLPHYLDNN